jgi:hypothetical protein
MTREQNLHIQTDSKEGYVIEEFKFHNKGEDISKL